jgi:hypothetical protein
MVLVVRNWPIVHDMPISEHILADMYRYLDDNASVDAISSKLREVCPSLYRREDAACSKVTAHISLFESLLEGFSEVPDFVHHPIIRSRTCVCTQVKGWGDTCSIGSVRKN